MRRPVGVWSKNAAGQRRTVVRRARWREEEAERLADTSHSWVARIDTAGGQSRDTSHSWGTEAGSN